MFKDLKEGATNHCDHTDDNTICDECLGKEDEFKKIDKELDETICAYVGNTEIKVYCKNCEYVDWIGVGFNSKWMCLRDYPPYRKDFKSNKNNNCPHYKPKLGILQRIYNWFK